MYFYDEDSKRVKVELGELISNKGLYGGIYKLADNDNECIKIYKRGQVVNKEILEFIRSLDLKNFYKIYGLLFSKKGNLRSHTMKFYQSEDIDILTMPVEYTLYNLYNLHESVIRLAEEYIYASDMHTDNVILGSDEITVIDVDIYSRSQLQSIEQLKKKNISALRSLFMHLFLEALEKYHPEIPVYDGSQNIMNIFGSYKPFNLDNTCSKLIRYKKPIDYIRRGK